MRAAEAKFAVQCASNATENFSHLRIALKIASRANVRRRSVDDLSPEHVSRARMDMSDFPMRGYGLGSVRAIAPFVKRGRRSTLSRRYRSMGIKRSVAARVHMFKRVGEPICFMQVGDPGNRLKPVGNTDLINPTGYNPVPDQFIANATQTGIAWRFSLNQVAKYQEITDLFDNYRLKKVRLTFTYSANAPISPAGYGGGQTVPIMHHTYDPDDDHTPVYRSDVLQNSYTKTTRLDRVITIDIVPRAQSVINKGTDPGAVAGGLLARNTWIDCDSPDVKHYGEKCWLETFPFVDGNDSQFSLVVTPTYYIEARNVV